MTRKELSKIKDWCEWNGWKIISGYCCIQQSKDVLIKIGSNCGVYGWNWDAYIAPNEKTLYIDGYSNF